MAESRASGAGRTIVAKVMNPALSMAASGSVGGVTFQRSGSGFIARSRPDPVQPDTTLQLEKRALMTTASQAWRNLTDQQRYMWQQVARQISRVDSLGHRYHPNGYNQFMSVNLFRLNYGYSVLNSPLECPRTLQTGFSTFYDAAMNEITVTGEFEGTVPDLENVWATGVLSDGAKPRVPDWRNMGTGTPPNGVTFTPEQPGQIWIRSRWVSSAGIVGNWFQSPDDPFSPNDISGLDIWASGQDVTKTGSLIDSMNGLQGELGWSQSVPSYKPTWVDAVVNGLPIARFDGSNTYMGQTGGGIGSKGAAFLVLKNNGSTFRGYLSGRGTSAASLIRYSTSTLIRIRDNAGVVVDMTGVTLPTGFHVFAFQYDGTNYRIRVNGTDWSVKVGTGSFGFRELGSISFGGVPTAVFNGDMAETLTYIQDLTADEIDQVEEYLMTKYNIS